MQIDPYEMRKDVEIEVVQAQNYLSPQVKFPCYPWAASVVDFQQTICLFFSLALYLPHF